MVVAEFLVYGEGEDTIVIGIYIGTFADEGRKLIKHFL
jgi:hypothetical protein